MDQTVAKTLAALGEVLRGQGRKDISGVPGDHAPFAPGGLFGMCGLDQVVITAHVRPQGLDSILPVFPSVTTMPFYPSITGFEGDGSANPDGVCEDCPSGFVQSCLLTAQFGRICQATQELEIDDLLRKINRGVFTDLRVMGSVLGEGLIQPQVPADWLRLATTSQMVIAGVAAQRSWARMLWQGNPANNSAGGGYKESPGLDLLINTGKVDAETGVLCPALDSDVKNFGYGHIDGFTPDIVEYVSMMDAYLRFNANRMGLAPVDWVLVMRPELWYTLTEVWPCRYLTNHCMGVPGGPAAIGIVNDDVNMRLRQEMREGKFLWVNGRQLPVVEDDGIFEENGINSANVDPGCFASDIYQVPLRARGMPMTYLEYMDYRTAGAEVAFLKGKERFWWTDDGRVMWTYEDKKWCFKATMKIEPRVILRAPHLAGRIQNVQYCPMQHFRSAFDDDPYFKKGGEYTRPVPKPYSEWDGRWRWR